MCMRDGVVYYGSIRGDDTWVINSRYSMKYCTLTAQYTDPMLVQCWSIVCDAGPTFGQCIVFAGYVTSNKC